MDGTSGGRGVVVQQLIGEIYEASYRPHHWPVVLQGIAALTESSSGGLIYRNAELEQASFAYTYNFPPDVVLRLRKTWYYREYLVPWDNHYVVTAIIFGADSLSGAPVSVCANWRRSSGSPFAEDDRERLKLLVPHLSRSLGVLHRVRAAEISAASSLAMLNRLPTGVLLVDAQGEVTFANDSGHRLLEKNNGLGLKRQSGNAGLGTLAADDSATNRAIASAIAATLACDPLATDHFSKYVRVPKRCRTAHYILQFSALGQHHEYHHGEHSPATIGFLSDQSDTYNVEPELLPLPAKEVRSARRVVPGRRRTRAYRRSGHGAKALAGEGDMQAYPTRRRANVGAVAQGSRRGVRSRSGRRASGAPITCRDGRVRKGDWEVPFRITSLATLLEAHST